MKRKAVSPIVVATVAASLMGGIPSKGLAVENPRVAASTTLQSKSLAAAARHYLGMPYNHEGRNAPGRPGVDALGLVMLSLQDRFGIGWKTWNSSPARFLSQLDSSGGKAVLLPADSSNDHDLTRHLKDGDILFFLWPSGCEAEGPVAKDQSGNSLYAWHAAIYSGKGNVIHASDLLDQKNTEVNAVVQEPLVPLLRKNGFLGFVALRYRGD